MRIGLLPPFEMSSSPKDLSTGGSESRSSLASVHRIVPGAFAEACVMRSAIYGGNDVDSDHQ